jgi:TonB family protein
VTHFDFDDRYQDELVVGNAISRREGVIWSVMVHLAIVVALLLAPRLGLFERSPEEIQQEREQLAQQREENPRFVFMEPRLDRPNRPRERPELSDQDRRAQTRERPPEPKNALPFNRGDSPERVEASRAEQPKSPEIEPPTPKPEEPQQTARNIAPTPNGVPREETTSPRPPAAGTLGEAVKNLQRYTQNHTFNNPQGGGADSNAAIQFDSKGADFGPWLRRFVSQVKRNWFVPLSAMSFRGHVVLQFNIHRNGRITDVTIAQPSDIDSFNRAAYNAILGSNPTEPLPPEYPDDKVFFTVTFYYNEQPGS